MIGGSQDSVVRDPTKRSSIDHLTNLEESVLGREPEGGSSNALESETGDDMPETCKHGAGCAACYCLACTPFCTALWCLPVAFHCGQRCAIAGGKMEPKSALDEVRKTTPPDPNPLPVLTLPGFLCAAQDGEDGIATSIAL